MFGFTNFGPVVTRAAHLAALDETRVARADEVAREAAAEAAYHENIALASQQADMRGQPYNHLTGAGLGRTVAAVLDEQAHMPDPPDMPAGAWGWVGPVYDMAARQRPTSARRSDDAVLERARAVASDPFMRRMVGEYRDRRNAELERAARAELERMERAAAADHADNRRRAQDAATAERTDRDWRDTMADLAATHIVR